MYHILIVDDEPIVKVALKTLLQWEENGFVICASASDGKEALALVEIHHPDIIITDLKMPVMDGLTLIQTLQKQQYPGKILVLSNYGDYEYVREALKSGAVDYMLKIRLNPEMLLDQLNTCVNALDIVNDRTNALCEDTALQTLVLKHYFTGYETKDSILRSLSFDPQETFFLCLLTQPFQPCFINGNNREISLAFLQNLLQETYQYLPVQCFLPMGSNRFLIVYPKKNADTNACTVLQIGTQIQTYFLRFFALSLSVVVTPSAHRLQELKADYYNCIETSLLDFYQTAAVRQAYNNTLQSTLPWENYRTCAGEVLILLSRSDQPCELALFQKILKCAEQSRVHPEGLKDYCMKLCSYLEVSMRNTQSIALPDTLHAIETCVNCNVLAQIMQAFFEKIAQQLQGEVSFYKKEVVHCIRYMQEHYHKKITLQDLAQAIAISETYLCKIFKEDTGMSTTQYLNKIRMERAAQLICEDKMYLKNIAEMVGVSDQFYFSRLFKKHFSMAPLQYKNANKKSVQTILNTQT